MHTQCPGCETVFRIHPDQLAAASGKVRCGACQTIFDARQHLVEAPKPQPPRQTPPPPAEHHEPEPVVDQAPELPPIPEFKRPRGGFATLVWVVLNLVLMVTLVGQYAYYHRERFAAQPALRPSIEVLCKLTGCTLSTWRDTAAFELTSRNVQSHPDYDKSLLVDATFVNRAALAQPYPDLEVTFLDTEERPVASRRFTPAEYLQNPSGALLEPGAEAHAVLEILDPGDSAFGFEFAFR